MAVNFSTNTPKALLDNFKKQIDDKKIVTWRYDADGDFTHTPIQWDGKAWMRPAIDTGGLRFNVIGSSGHLTSWEIYSVYQGRFIEAMVSHCHDLFTIGSATSKPTNSDAITTKVA